MTDTTYRDGPARWREDTGWELRCDSCATKRRQRFWPLTREFWDPRRGTKRCLACTREIEARRHRERYRNDPEYRARKRAANDAQRAAEAPFRKLIAHKRWEERKARIAAMTEEERAIERAKVTERQRRYRAKLRAAA